MSAVAPTVTRVVRPAERRHAIARTQMLFAAAMVCANVDGGLTVFFFLGVALPRPNGRLLENVVALVACMLAGVAIGCIVSARAFAPILQWARDGRPVTVDERTYLVRHPLRQAGINFAMWLGAVAVFVPINWSLGGRQVADVASTIVMGGITTCGLTYLMAERILRPLNQMAFEHGLPTDKFVPGVKSRLLLAWAIGTGVPLLGIVLMAVDHGSRPISAAGLAFLGCVGLSSGAMATLFVAKSVADPITSVTGALADVEEGHLDVAVPVYDASQIGQLQNGFNAMVDGLRERRALRDLFGRQVGEDVAAQALERGVRLGGEQVHAAVLFVDVIGSTALAAARPPAAVVAALNEFFAIVVDVVSRTGGFVNKFEGDAALCVFGAPVHRDDADACALLAARLLSTRLADVNGLSAAIGVSAGQVVAGNVGTKERFEYTVIGDAVNEAARLTELAKDRPDRLLVSALLLDSVPDEERAHWRREGSALLRGRTQPTLLAVTG